MKKSTDLSEKSRLAHFIQETDLSEKSRLAHFIQEDDASGFNDYCERKKLDFLQFNVNVIGEGIVPIAHYVASCGSVNVMRSILDSKTNQEKKDILVMKDSKERVPMYHALANENVGMFCLLYKNGYNEEKLVQEEISAIPKGLFRGRIMCIYNNRDHVLVTGKLARNDYFFDKMDQWTKANKQFEVYTCIKECLKKSIDDIEKNLSPYSPNITGLHTDCIDTPLHVIAFESRNVNNEKCNLMAQYFLTRKANPNAINEYGSTPLHVAMYCFKPTNYNYELIKLFLNNGADPNIKNFDGKIPLDLVSEVYRETIGRLIKENTVVKINYDHINKVNQQPQETTIKSEQQIRTEKILDKPMNEFKEVLDEQDGQNRKGNDSSLKNFTEIVSKNKSIIGVVVVFSYLLVNYYEYIPLNPRFL